MPEIKPSDIQTFASIKVVGVGGAGGSAVNRMKEAGLAGVQFIAMNTDAQALHNSKADVKIHLALFYLCPAEAYTRRKQMTFKNYDEFVGLLETCNFKVAEADFSKPVETPFIAYFKDEDKNVHIIMQKVCNNLIDKDFNL